MRDKDRKGEEINTIDMKKIIDILQKENDKK